MVNQQKGVQQDTAYSAVVVNDHMYPRPYIVCDSKGVIETCIGRDGDTYDYNCTIGSFLLHSFLMIYHPYPPSFHEMIFILVIYTEPEFKSYQNSTCYYVLTQS